MLTALPAEGGTHRRRTPERLCVSDVRPGTARMSALPSRPPGHVAEGQPGTRRQWSGAAGGIQLPCDGCESSAQLKLGCLVLEAGSAPEHPTSCALDWSISEARYVPGAGGSTVHCPGT